jgi:hypothetical protein
LPLKIWFSSINVSAIAAALVIYAASRDWGSLTNFPIPRRLRILRQLPILEIPQLPERISRLPETLPDTLQSLPDIRAERTGRGANIHTFLKLRPWGDLAHVVDRHSDHLSDPHAVIL